MNNTNIVFIVKRSNFDVASSRPFFKALLFELTFKNHTRRKAEIQISPLTIISKKFSIHLLIGIRQFLSYHISSSLGLVKGMLGNEGRRGTFCSKVGGS